MISLFTFESTMNLELMFGYIDPRYPQFYGSKETDIEENP
jgi:hypothetical protein